ncbi:MAG: hypothetical protein B5M48_04685 [Candidatus Omnitrophica bacterium 4484_213]|nr:MAG: hypothetical protein B5M48_04685 [Candidatus Omnitrophica bacterium 4484_213]
MTKVKICGITNREDALKAVELGVDALGFIFAPSPRRVESKQVKEIIKKLPPEIIKVGVFVDASLKEAGKISKDCCLDALQLHGRETPAYCDELKKISSAKLIKTFHLREEKDLQEISDYNLEIICLDSYTQERMGGTGKVFNWDLAKRVKRFNKKIILSGGLNPDNVQEAITEVQPYMVDVCSGVEKKPGKKDEQLMKEFIYRAGTYFHTRCGSKVKEI